MQFPALLVIFALAFPPKALAYLEPATGSYVMQFIIGAILTVIAGLVAFKNTIFGKKRGRKR